MKRGWMRRMLGAMTLATLGAMAQGQAPAQSAGSITIATYNIHGAVPLGNTLGGYRATVADVRNVADVITTTGADIIGLQEVRNMWNPPSAQPPFPPLDIALELSRFMNMQYVFGGNMMSKRGFPENREYMQWGGPGETYKTTAPLANYGNALLSRVPLKLPASIIKLPASNDERAKELGREPRNAIRVELANELPGLGRVVVYNTHFHHNYAPTRRLQMQELLKHATKDAQNATVFIIGDLNHHRQPDKKNDLIGLAEKAGFHDLAARHAEATGKPAPGTLHGPRESRRRIDYVLCSRPLQVTASSVLETPVSDHLPVIITVALPIR